MSRSNLATTAERLEHAECADCWLLLCCLCRILRGPDGSNRPTCTIRATGPTPRPLGQGWRVGGIECRVTHHTLEARRDNPAEFRAKAADRTPQNASCSSTAGIGNMRRPGSMPECRVTFSRLTIQRHSSHLATPASRPYPAGTDYRPTERPFGKRASHRRRQCHSSLVPYGKHRSSKPIRSDRLN